MTTKSGLNRPILVAQRSRAARLENRTQVVMTAAPSTSASGPITETGFLFDLDNTLIDNDRVKADLHVKIERNVGPQHAIRFWEPYEAVRIELDYVDSPRTLGRFAHEAPHSASSRSATSADACSNGRGSAGHRGDAEAPSSVMR